MGLPQPLSRWVENAHGTPLEPLVYLVRWGWLFYLELRQDLAFVRAAGMAYATVVALVPSLVLIIGLAQPLGIIGDDPANTLRAFVDPLMGDMPEVGAVLVDGLVRVNLGTLGIFATIGLLVVAGRLYLSIELAYNDILGVPVRRSFQSRLLSFWFAITVVPVILLIGLRSSLDGVLARAGGPWTLPIVGRMLLFLVLLAAIKLLPSMRMRWIPAILGTSTSFLLIELGRRGFSAYVSLFGGEDPMMAVYGSIGLFPVFLLWIYLFWLFVLLGVEVTNVAQNHSTLSQAEFEVDEGNRFPSFEVAVQVATWIAWLYQAGKGPASLEGLTAATRLPARHLRPVVEILEKSGIVVRSELGWILARPAESIPITEIIDVWRRFAVPITDAPDLVREEFARRLAIEGSLADGVRRWIDRPLNSAPLPNPVPEVAK